METLACSAVDKSVEPFIKERRALEWKTTENYIKSGKLMKVAQNLPYVDEQDIIAEAVGRKGCK